MIKNVAAMMFSNHPEKFFPYTQISIVVFPEGKIQNPNRFSEKTFKGSVPTIIRGAMQYLKRRCHNRICLETERQDAVGTVVQLSVSGT